ncbi:MAG: MarR family transcriptional regulator [Candidatus Nealsonbacteria bacterium]|nr:MarR family transcriptional regulator [Candidatus Nealsonbacteria bacterium]
MGQNGNVASNPSVSAAGMRMMNLLVGKPPQTVQDLIDSTDVTRTAITEQLNELLLAGLIERKRQPPTGRGRPRHLYSATTASLTSLFPNSQSLVVPAMWSAIEEVGGSKLTRQILRRVVRSLADHYKRKMKSTKPEQRLRELAKLLRKEGGLVEATREGKQLVLRRRSCQFISMLDDNRLVCAVDLQLLTQVVGRPMRRTACRLEGAPCCTFVIADKK